MNLARIRVWTAGDYVYQNALTIAERAQAVGASCRLHDIAILYPHASLHVPHR